MVAVFSIFATLSLIEFKVFGVAMAAAILIDATIVRGVLLPAGLALLGDRVWPQKPRRSRHARVIPAVPAPVADEVTVR
jgi:RND superfamily putative drug exporter